MELLHLVETDSLQLVKSVCYFTFVMALKLNSKTCFRLTQFIDFETLLAFV